MPDGVARSYCGLWRGRVTKNPHGDALHAAAPVLLIHRSSASRPVDSPVTLPSARQSIWANSRWNLALKQRHVSAFGPVTAPRTASLQRSADRRPVSQQLPARGRTVMRRTRPHLRR